MYACVRFLAEGVAKLPLQQYRDAGDRKVKITPGQLLSKPSSYLRLFDWLYQYVTAAALHGNAYGLITSRDGYGYPTTVEWLPPEAVNIKDSDPWNPAKTQFSFYGKPLNRDELLHIPAFTVPGRTKGFAPLEMFQMLIQSGIDALAYGADWYKAGGFPPGTFQNTQYEVEKEQSDQIKKRLVDAMRRREPLVYGRDWEYKPITVPPDQAQFIQSQQLTATQIAVIYGVQPRRAGGIHGDSQTYSNTSMDQIAEITDTLDPWLIRLESALDDCLPSAQHAQFNRDARLRTTTAERYAVYKDARNIGILNVDEIRALEDRDPLPKSSDPDAYDGTDYTPLQIMVAAARGLKQELGTEEDLAPVMAKPAAASSGQPAVPPAEKVPAGQPAAVAAANGSGRHG